MILHTVNKPPGFPPMASCLQFAAADDVILLLEDGVYHGAAGAAMIAGIDNPVYAIEADVMARGLSGRMQDGVTLVDYAGFVELCTQCKLVKNWS